MIALTTLFTGILAAIASIAGIWQLAIVLWRTIQPRIVVRLIGQPSNSYSLGKQVTLTFEFENVGGHTRIPSLKRKLILHDITIQVFFPRAFSIKQVKRQVSLVPEVGKTLFEVPSSGRFENKSYQYIFVPDPFDRKPPTITSMAHGETERCQIMVTTPETKGDYKVLFDISAREGPLEQQQAILTVENPIP